MSPKIIGGRESVLSIEGRGVNRIVDAAQIKEVRLKQFDKDLLIEGIIKEY